MARLTNHQRAQLHLVKGAAASIMLLMILAPGHYTTKDLQRETGWSDKTITNALEKLVGEGTIAITTHGYTLAPLAKQLTLFPQSLISTAPPNLIVANQPDAPAQIAEKTTPAPNTAETQASEIFRKDGNSPPSSLFIYSSPSPLEEQKINKQNKRAYLRRKISELTATEPTATLWSLLRRANVTDYSPMMLEILEDERIDEDTVCWHCYAAKILGDAYPASHLINNILNGQNPPRIKHGEHLDFMAEYFPDLAEELRPQAEAATNPASRYIPAELADIIQR